MADSNEIGRTISNLRKTAGFTQKELADALNVTDKAVSKWERGVACPDISLLPKLSALLDCDIEPILSGLSTIHSRTWKGILELDGGMDASLPVYDKPMVYYLLSNFLLAGINDITIVCNELQKERLLKILDKVVEFGIFISYAKTFEDKDFKGNYLFIMKGNYFFFGASLTRQFQAFMSAKENLQISESNGNNLSLYFIKDNDIKIFEKKVLNRGIISIPLDSYENLNDASNLIKIFQVHSKQQIADIKEIAINRNFLPK